MASQASRFPRCDATPFGSPQVHSKHPRCPRSLRRGGTGRRSPRAESYRRPHWSQDRPGRWQSCPRESRPVATDDEVSVRRLLARLSSSRVGLQVDARERVFGPACGPRLPGSSRHGSRILGSPDRCNQRVRRRIYPLHGVDCRGDRRFDVGCWVRSGARSRENERERYREGDDRRCGRPPRRPAVDAPPDSWRSELAREVERGLCFFAEAAAGRLAVTRILASPCQHRVDRLGEFGIRFRSVRRWVVDVYQRTAIRESER